jgi:hypothetical protein
VRCGARRSRRKDVCTLGRLSRCPSQYLSHSLCQPSKSVFPSQYPLFQYHGNIAWSVHADQADQQHSPTPPASRHRPQPAPSRGAAPLRAQTAQRPGLLPRHTPSSRAGPNGAGPGQRMREPDQACRLRRAWRSWKCVNPVSLTLRRTYSQAPTSVWECVGVHSFHRLPRYELFHSPPRYELPRLVSRAARRLAHFTPTPDADLPWLSVLTVPVAQRVFCAPGWGGVEVTDRP